MKYKLIGYSPASFKGDNGNIEGFNLYLVAALEGPGAKGVYSFRQFVISSKCPALDLGSEYDLSFRRGNGKLETIKKVS